jgi:hypothetical protein
MVNLKSYTLFYTFNQVRIPSTVEVDGVANLTQTYLSAFFKAQYAEIDKLETNLTSSTFLLLRPYQANYTAKAEFTSTAATVPTTMELDATLMSAFVGSNNMKYLAKLHGLPTTNIFQTTTAVLLLFQTNPIVKAAQTTGSTGSTGSQQQSKARVAGGIAAGAGAFVAILMAVAIRHYYPQGGKQKGRNDGMDKDDDDAAHVTVAGDTYLADNSTVFSGQSARRRTRFAEETRFMLDENQSLASRSEWGLSTRGISEVGSEDSDEEDRADRGLFADEEKLAYNRTLLNDGSEETKVDVLAMRDDMRLPRHYTSADELPDNDDLSVDADVPMKVVDLIKKFTPARKSSW